jgi:hypothetical protein
MITTTGNPGPKESHHFPLQLRTRCRTVKTRDLDSQDPVLTAFRSSFGRGRIGEVGWIDELWGRGRVPDEVEHGSGLGTF